MTAVGGNCSPAKATRNLQAIVKALDPPRSPLGRRLGARTGVGLRRKAAGLYGPDGLGAPILPVAERQHCRRPRK